MFKAFFDHKYIGHMEHPTLKGLWLFDYEREAFFDRAWDEYTTVARGLVLRDDGTVIGRGLRKFWNVGENNITIHDLPKSVPTIYEKVDGSFILLFVYNGEIHCTTRGSWNSDQAKWAQNYARCKWSPADFLPNYSYWFEFVGPSNRVVVEYPEDTLVLLGLCQTETGVEDQDILEWALKLNTVCANHFHFDSIEEVVRYLAVQNANTEGFVLCYEVNGKVERYKIKGEAYVKAHMFRFGLSSKVIWRSLMAGENPISKDTPEEFYGFINGVVNELVLQFKAIYDEASMIYHAVSNLPTRKEQAIFLMQNHREYASLVFGLLDGRDISESVWKMIEPEYVPFKDTPANKEIIFPDNLT